ncbi:MAG: glutathione S-transferase family protein [Pseudomonadota bacterium]
MLTLFHHPLSSASRFIRLVLEEYEEAANLHEENVFERRPVFLELNPACTLPVLQDGASGPICGASAIAEYLDETRGPLMRERRLLPETAIERAEARRLVDWSLTKLEDEVTHYLVRERALKRQLPPEQGGGSPDSGVIRAAKTNLKHHMKYFAWLAVSRNWFAGEKMSYADLAAASSFSVLDYLGEVSWDEEPGLKDWYARIKSRPSFRSLLAERVKGLPPTSHYSDLDF